MTIRIMTKSIGPVEKRILFKLTAPTNEVDGELGEFISDPVVRLGLGGDVFKALGYSWRGGHVDINGEHRFWYKPVERNRFDNGPIYIELVYDSVTNKLIKVTRMDVSLGDGTVGVNPHVLQDNTPRPPVLDQKSGGEVRPGRR